MVADVLNGQPLKLIESAKSYAAVRTFVTAQAAAITEAYSLPLDSDFSLYGADKCDDMRQEFYEHKNAWQLQLPGLLEQVGQKS